jgi:hypothetical protein
MRSTTGQGQHSHHRGGSGEQRNIVGRPHQNCAGGGGDESPRTTCIIQVLQGEENKKNLEGELNNLINKEWDWHVKQVENKKFIAIFSDKNSLETFSKLSEVLMSIHGMKVEIIKSNVDT